MAIPVTHLNRLWEKYHRKNTLESWWRKAKPKAQQLWNDEESLLLIKYFKIEDPLYNTKSDKIHIKDV